MKALKANLTPFGVRHREPREETQGSAGLAPRGVIRVDRAILA